MEEKIHSCPELVDYVNRMGLLPLLNVGIHGWSAEQAVDDDCQYTVLPDGGWEWPLWQWKGSVLRESGCAYGKFFAGKAGFVSQQWWPHFCNYRRSLHPEPAEGSIEEAILHTLAMHGSMITRELRAACGFAGPKMRSKFDAYITRLQMQCRIVTQDFVYPLDRHGHRYGWGWALLTTPEQLFGSDKCKQRVSPDESHRLLVVQFHKILPWVSDEFIERILK